MSEEKLNELKEKVANLQEEIRELTSEELAHVSGGVEPPDIQFKPVITSPSVPAGGGW